MGCRSSDDSSSSQGSAQNNFGLVNDVGCEAGYETDVTDAPDAGSHDGSHDASKGELADSAWLLANSDHPPEYHIRQWQDGNDEEEDEEDYSPGIKLLLNRIDY